MDQRMVDVEGEELAHRLDGILRRIGDDALAGGANFLAVQGYQRDQQITLRLEVVVDRARSDLGLGGDRFDAGVGEAVAAEQLGRRRENVAPPYRLLPLAQ